MICPKCCNKLADNSAFCSKCGTPVMQAETEKASAKKCPLCGTEYPPSTKFCRHDGQALREPDVPLVAGTRQETVAIGLICPVCGTSNPLTAKFCRVDGTALQAATPESSSGMRGETGMGTENKHTQASSSPQRQHAADISQEPDKGRRKILIWALLALALLGGGGAGGYYLHNIQSKEREKIAENSAPPVQNLPSEKQEPAPEPPPVSAPHQERSAAPQPLQPATQMNAGMYPDASLRLLGAPDLSGKSKFDLKIMRNEIFARHGYIFRTPDMQRYFSSQPWYAPRFADVTGMLTQVEKANVEFIKKYERMFPR